MIESWLRKFEWRKNGETRSAKGKGREQGAGNGDEEEDENEEEDKNEEEDEKVLPETRASRLRAVYLLLSLHESDCDGRDA